MGTGIKRPPSAHSALFRAVALWHNHQTSVAGSGEEHRRKQYWFLCRPPRSPPPPRQHRSLCLGAPLADSCPQETRDRCVLSRASRGLEGPSAPLEPVSAPSRRRKRFPVPRACSSTTSTQHRVPRRATPTQSTSGCRKMECYRCGGPRNGQRCPCFPRAIGRFLMRRLLVSPVTWAVWV